LGKGRVIWGKNAEQVLAGMNVHVDFAADGGLKGNLRYIHRTLEDGTELYFVANKRQALVGGTCSFRVEGKRPEFWWPQSGGVQLAAAWQEKDGVTRVPLYLEPAESVFVVFRSGPRGLDPVVAMTHDGQSFPALPTPPRVAPPPPKIVVLKAIYGVQGDKKRTRDVKTAVQKLVDQGETSFVVMRLASGGDPAFGTQKTLTVQYTIDGTPHEVRGVDPETIDLLAAPMTDAKRPAMLSETARGSLLLEAWQNGRFELTTASGRKLASTVGDLPPPRTVAGPWQVTFPAGPGGMDFRVRPPESRTDSEVHSTARRTDSEVHPTAEHGVVSGHVLTLDSLVAWNLHPDDAVKYFSGTATYAKVLNVPVGLLRRDFNLYLDLGRVAVMARVKLNGHDLGVLWKAPYRVEIGGFAKDGENRLEIEVTNLWINRMIGDENLPEDSDRNADGTLKAWPKWLLEGKSSPTGRQTFTSWRLWRKDDPLDESGLLGPVTLRAARRVVLR
jgi:hypothetical protein